MENKIIMYTLPKCGYCEALKSALKMRDIHFEINQDVDEIASLGFQSVPQLKVGNKIMNYKQAIEWINNGSPMGEK